MNWEVIKTSNETNGDIPIITKQLVGHVDNSSYPEVTVDIQLTLSTPANATGPVPVIMELSFGRSPGAGPIPARPGSSGAAPSGPTWQQQVLAKGWGYSTLVPTSHSSR